MARAGLNSWPTAPFASLMHAPDDGLWRRGRRRGRKDCVRSGWCAPDGRTQPSSALPCPQGALTGFTPPFTDASFFSLFGPISRITLSSSLVSGTWVVPPLRFAAKALQRGISAAANTASLGAIEKKSKEDIDKAGTVRARRACTDVNRSPALLPRPRSQQGLTRDHCLLLTPADSR